MSLSPSNSLEPPKRDSPPVFFSKTCQNCFALKIRCDRTQRNDICDRCARLGKNCVFRPARRRDNSAKRDSRIQALEQQVQDLLRLQRAGPASQQSLPEGSASMVTSSSESASSTSTHNAELLGEAIVAPELADTLVDLYKSDMMAHFPYVCLAPHVNGRMLRYDKPFLYVAVLSVASYHDPVTQEKLVDKFKQLVSEKVFLGGNDMLTLEYLQGLLVVLAWNHYHHKSQYFSQYLLLAVSIAVDSRYDRKPVRSQPGSATEKRNPLYEPESGWGSEEQRATAGLFFLSSTISRLFDKTNTFPYTRYIEDGCLALKERAEFKTDRELHHVVRLQRMIEAIDMLASPTFSDEETNQAFMQTRAEFDRFGNELKSEVDDRSFVVVQYHTARLFLYQVSFFERKLHRDSAIYLSALREGIEAAKQFLDFCLSLRTKAELNLTNAEWVQLDFGTTLAAKFVLAGEDPAVEAQTRDVRKELNFPHVIRQMCLRVSALASRADGPNRENDVFAYFDQRLRKVRLWYESMSRVAYPGLEADTQQTSTWRQESQTLHHTNYAGPAAYGMQENVGYSGPPVPAASILNPDVSAPAQFTETFQTAQEGGASGFPQIPSWDIQSATPHIARSSFGAGSSAGSQY
ncbi:hypothetical protein M011DRAFT_487604 [Sporormia fimetaria CBS 119925]|uniref:Zn(2)-C6 fungal-type domain-containing protein n=1 Tax=Sporormia fimetaria CBS 119925 TaxID=1340428 RepID=A0A6A6V978_9PLEO|nr:hypothetical protein M011DRAFT_487604 [Sporormia fimetaria CBS 119925]